MRGLRNTEGGTMPFSDLENFKVLAEKLNFTNAAKALFMSQPSLSKSISRLEERLGFSLFNRSTREVELTASGRSFYKDTVELLDLYEQAVSRARAQSKHLGAPVRVGGHFANPRIYGIHDMTRSLLAAEGAPFDVLTDDRHVGSIERKPGLDDPFNDALDGVNDVNLLYCSSKVAHSRLVLSEPLFSEELGIFVPRGSDLAHKEKIRLADLAGHCIIRTTTYGTFSQAVEDILETHSIEFRTRTRVVDSMGDLMQCRSNDEVIMLAKSMANLVPATREPAFVQLSCTDEDARVSIVATYLPEKLTPSVERYVEAAQRIARQ